MANTRTAKNPTLADVTRKLKPAERVVRMCVSGDLYAEHQRLEAQLDSLLESTFGSRKINDTGTAEKNRLADQITQLEKKMDAESFDFRFQSMTKHEWSDLQGKHPPRDGVEIDKRMGFNEETFSAAAVQRCCVSPAGMDDDAAFTAFWDTLSSGQRDVLFYQGAWAANRETGSVPKSVNASAVMSRSKQSSDSVAE